MRVFWIEAQPYNSENGQSPECLAVNIDLTPVVMFGGKEYLPIVDGGPVFTTTVFNGAFAGTADTARGQINLVTGPGEIDSWARLMWQGRPFKIYRGVIDTSDPMNPIWPASRTLMFDGLSESFDPDEASFALTMHKPEGQVAKKTFAGTGGAEGTAALRNVRKPFSIGAQKNRVPVMVNAGKLLFCCNDGIIGSLLVREGGIPLDQPLVAHSSFDSLFNATVPATEIHWHPASGFFRIGFTPAGEISADYRGGFGGALPAVTTVTAIVSALLDNAGWTRGRNSTSFAAIAAALPDDAQFHDSAGVDVLDALTDVLRGAGCYWDVDPLGVFYIGAFVRDSVSDFDVGDEGLGEFDLLDTDYLPTRAPFWKHRVAWGFNSNVLTFADTTLGISEDQLDLLYSVQDLVDGSLEVFIQATEPATAAERDLWYNTTTSVWNKRTDGAWVPTPGLGALGDALLNAAGAQAAADGKIKLTYTDAEPPAPRAVGDQWIRPSDKPRQTRRWSGSAWEVIANLVTDAVDVTYSDGTTVQVMKPRQAGADKTIDNTAAAIAGQAPAATDATIQPGATNDQGSDTRSQNFPPLFYRQNWFLRHRIEFKEINALGRPVGAIGTYGTLRTIAQWSDVSGGPVQQILEDSGGRRFIRLSNAGNPEGWSGWAAEYSENRKPAFGGDLLETVDGAFAVLSAFKTLLGNSAGFTGQGSLATLSQLTLGGPYLSGFGQIAGLSSLAYGSSYLTGFGALSPLSTISFGSNFLLEQAGGASATLTAFKTILGQSASIIGQAPTATNSDYSVITGTKPLENAGTAGPPLVATTSDYVIRGNSIRNVTANPVWGGVFAVPTPLRGAARAQCRFFNGTGNSFSSLNFGFSASTTSIAANSWNGANIFGVGVSTDASPNYYIIRGGNGSTGDYSNTGVPFVSGDILTLDYQGTIISIFRTTVMGATTQIGTIDLANYGGPLPVPFYVKGRMPVPGDYATDVVVGNQNDPNWSSIVGSTKPENNATFGANIVNNVRDGTTLLGRSDLLTSLGTAAGFTGQGPFATAPALNRNNLFSYFAASSFSLGYTITRSDGTTTVTESAVVTQQGVAAGFAGQGALATQSTVAWRTQMTGAPDYVTNPMVRNGLEYLQAGYVFKGTGFGDQNMFDYFPQDLQSNRTEIRIATAVYGQGSFATKSQAGYYDLDINSLVQRGTGTMPSTQSYTNPGTYEVPGTRVTLPTNPSGNIIVNLRATLNTQGPGSGYTSDAAIRVVVQGPGGYSASRDLPYTFTNGEQNRVIENAFFPVTWTSAGNVSVFVQVIHGSGQQPTQSNDITLTQAVLSVQWQFV